MTIEVSFVSKISYRGMCFENGVNRRNDAEDCQNRNMIKVLENIFCNRSIINIFLTTL